MQSICGLAYRVETEPTANLFQFHCHGLNEQWSTQYRDYKRSLVFDQAGSVSFTVSALSPWSQVASGMAPKFVATADSLLATSIASTQWQQSQTSEAFSASGAITLPGGTPASIPSATPPTGESLPPPAGAMPTGPQGIDPLLQYQAARDLYQSIQLMNHEMQLISTGSCYEPYIVMAKLSVVPNRIDVPDAVQSRVSFFPYPYDLSSDETVSADKFDGCNEPGWLPRVVPIIASDDLERAIRTNAAEVATQISAAISGSIHGVGGSLGASNLNASLNAINGSDFNNRMTVYRESGNTIGIRINPSFDTGGGAVNPKDAQRRLIGQTYDLALILLVPKAFTDPAGKIPVNEKYIESIMTTSFVDPGNGKPLPSKSEQELAQETKSLLASALNQSSASQKLPDTASFNQLSKIDTQLGDGSWARIGHALIYLSQTSHYDKLSQLLLNIVSNPDPKITAGYQKQYLTCQSASYSDAALSYTNSNLFNLPVDLQLDDASTCFVLSASWALNNDTSNFQVNPAAPSAFPATDGLGKSGNDYLMTGFLPAIWSGASQLSDEASVQAALTPLPESNPSPESNSSP